MKSKAPDDLRATSFRDYHSHGEFFFFSLQVYTSANEYTKSDFATLT